MDAEDLVTNRGKKRQNRKFRSDVARLVPGPIDLRPGEMKASLGIVPGDRGDVTLSPAPIVNVRLIDPDQPHRDCKDRHHNRESGHVCYGSPLDKACRQSQSSSLSLMKTAACTLVFLLGVAMPSLHAQNEPNLIPDVADPAKL